MSSTPAVSPAPAPTFTSNAFGWRFDGRMVEILGAAGPWAEWTEDLPARIPLAQFLARVAPYRRNAFTSALAQALDDGLPRAILHRGYQLNKKPVRLCSTLLAPPEGHDVMGTTAVAAVPSRKLAQAAWELRALKRKRPPAIADIKMEVTSSEEIEDSPKDLRREVAILLAASEASPDAALVVAPDGRILYSNPQFAKLWQIPERILRSASDAEALNWVRDQLLDPEGFIAKVQEIYDAPDSRSHDEIRLRDGRFLARDSAPVRGPLGEPFGRVWFFRDVTENIQAHDRAQFLLEERIARASAERALSTWQLLERINRRLAAAHDVETMLRDVAALLVGRFGSLCIFDVLDPAGPFRRVYPVPNHGQSALLDDLASERIDPHAPIGVGPALNARALCVAEVSCAGGFSPLGEPGGRAAAILQELGLKSLLIAPLFARGQDIGAMSLASAEPMDSEAQLIAEQVAQRLALAIEGAQLLRKAQEAVALRDEFLSVASHELRTPLTAMRLAHQTLLRLVSALGPAVPDSVIALARAADRHEARLSRLIDTLLDVTRIEGKRLVLELESVDLVALVRESAQLAIGEAERAGSTLHVEASEGVCGRWDRGRLDQVLANLLSNAIKYGAGQPIMVRARASEGWAELSVCDHGIGIPRDQQAQIFDRFERAVSSKHYAGLGLGLFIVRGIVRALGGSVEVESELGSGATFTIRLPLAGPSGVCHG